MVTRPITDAVLDEHDALRVALPSMADDWNLLSADMVDDGYPAEFAAYIAALANDDAAMCARVRELEGENARLRGALGFIARGDEPYFRQFSHEAMLRHVQSFARSALDRAGES